MNLPLIGFTATSTHEVTDARVQAFGAASGDLNPLHFDEQYATRTCFGGRIVHGMLTASFISAALAETFGRSGHAVVYVDQQLRFKRPVRRGDTITVTLEVIAVDPSDGRITLSTRCANQVGKSVLEGEATVLLQPLGG